MRLTKGRIALGIVLALAAIVVVLNWTWGRLPAEPPVTGRVMSVGDTQVRVLEHPGTEPAIVLIHGLPGTADDFDDVTALLPGRHTIAFDRPGFGFSSGDYHAFDDQLATISRLLVQLGVRRPVLVGHSYGGTIALGYAERHPQEVRGLVLVDAAAGGTHSDFVTRAQSRMVQVLSLPVVQPLADVTFSQLLRTASAKQADGAAFEPADADAGHEHRVLALNMKQDDLDAFADEQLHADDVIERIDAHLADVRTPAVVIQGARDTFVEPQYGRRLAAMLPNARLEMVGGGHRAPYVHPGVVAAAARELAASGAPGVRPSRAAR